MEKISNLFTDRDKNDTIETQLIRPDDQVNAMNVTVQQIANNFVNTKSKHSILPE